MPWFQPPLSRLPSSRPLAPPMSPALHLCPSRLQPLLPVSSPQLLHQPWQLSSTPLPRLRSRRATSAAQWPLLRSPQLPTCLPAALGFRLPPRLLPPQPLPSWLRTSPSAPPSATLRVVLIICTPSTRLSHALLGSPSSTRRFSFLLVATATWPPLRTSCPSTPLRRPVRLSLPATPCGTVVRRASPGQPLLLPFTAMTVSRIIPYQWRDRRLSETPRGLISACGLTHRHCHQATFPVRQLLLRRCLLSPTATLCGSRVRTATTQPQSSPLSALTATSLSTPSLFLALPMDMMPIALNFVPGRLRTVV